MSRAPLEPEPSLRLSYLAAAQYSYFRAETEYENLVSALRRMEAAGLARRLASRGIELPSPAEIRDWAVQRFGEERLHKDLPAPKEAA
jgi:hypothetical protein